MFKILESLIRWIVELIKLAITGIPEGKEGYNASFTWPGTLLSSRNRGFCLSGKRNLSVKNSFQNALVVGGTGSGKSSVVLIPSLYSMQGSFVIHDPSGELYDKSAGYLRQKGYEIKVLNFTSAEHSSNYNPLVRAQSSSDIQKVSSLLVENVLGSKAKDPFWNIQAISLLAMIITILKKQDLEVQNLYNVRYLLNLLGSNPQSVDSLFSQWADDVLFAEYKSFIAYDDKVVSGVIATCKAALHLIGDDAVARITSNDDLDFEQFRATPTALYIRNSVADQKYYSVLTSIFFEQFFAYVLSRFPKENEQNIFLLIDEASSLNLPTLSLAVANVRKHRGGIMLLVQDFNQLLHHYGKYDSEGIKSNCFAKLYFTGSSLETSKELEQTLGQFQYEDKKNRTVVRPLMTNDEIRTMKANRAILICGHYRPIIVRLKPYFKRSLYRKLSQITPPEITSESPLQPIPLLAVNSVLSNE